MAVSSLKRVLAGSGWRTSTRPAARRGAPDWGRAVQAVLPPFLAVCVFLSPVATFAVLGVSTVGLTEESTGYRYFYSLRILYTPDERPWLPQGQIMTLVHMALQVLITLAGFPVSQLTPRIEVFSILAAGAAHLATGVAALWALRPIRSLVGRLAVVAVLLVTAFDGSLSAGYHLLVPDYHPWIHAVTFVALGCALRLAAGSAAPDLRWSVGIGLLAGAAISLKVTLALLALPAILLLLWKQRTWGRLIAAGVVVGGLAAAVLLVCTWLSYGGSLAATAHYFALLMSFVGDVSSQPPPPFSAWFTHRLLGSDVTLATRLSAAAPLILAASAILLRPRLPALVCLPSLVLSNVLMWRRDEPTTFIEVFDAAYLALVVFGVVIAVPHVTGLLDRAVSGRLPRSLAGPPGVVARMALVVALIGLCVVAPVRGIRILLPGFRQTDEAQRAIDAFVLDPPGRVAILTPGNEYRPLTRDSAIFKGGTNVAESDLWGVSPFVASLVPERHYFYPSRELRPPINLEGFQYVLFASHGEAEPLSATQALLRETFGVSFIGFECPLRLPMPGSTQYGCRRLPDQPVDEVNGEIAFVARATDLESGGPVRWRHEAARPLRPGEMAYVGSTGEIWRLDASGGLRRVVGDPGDSVQVSSLGDWSRKRNADQGALATYRDGRWHVEDVQPHTINRNPNLRMQDDGSLRGWDILNRGSIDVQPERLPVPEYAPEGWLQLEARTGDGRLGVRTGLDRDEANDGPLMAVVSFRAFSPGGVTVQIGAAGPDNTVVVPNPTGSERVDVPAIGRWETVTVHVEQDQLQGDRVAVVVELTEPHERDRLDIGKVEVYAARLP